MKRVIFVYLFIILSIFCYGQQIVVIPTFEARGGYSNSDAETITDLFMAELTATGRISIVNRSSMEHIMAEIGFQLSDWSNDQKTIQLGRALNASSVIRGQVSQFGGRTIVTATMLDINTMKISNPARMQGEAWEIFDLMPDFCKQMLDNYTTSNPFVGRWRSILPNGYEMVIEFKPDYTSIIEHRDVAVPKSRVHGIGGDYVVNASNSTITLSYSREDRETYKYRFSGDGKTLYLSDSSGWIGEGIFAGFSIPYTYEVFNKL